MSTIDLSKPTFKSDLYDTCEHRQLSRNGKMAWCGDCGSTFGEPSQKPSATLIRHRPANTYRCEYPECPVLQVAKSLPDGWVQYGKSRHPAAQSGLASWCPKHSRSEFPAEPCANETATGVGGSEETDTV